MKEIGIGVKQCKLFKVFVENVKRIVHKECDFLYPDLKWTGGHSGRNLEHIGEEIEGDQRQQLHLSQVGSSARCSLRSRSSKTHN